MFRHYLSYTIKDLFSQTQNDILLEFQRIKTFQTIPNTPLRCLNFSFQIVCNGRSEKAGKQLHCRLILETIIRFKIVR